MLRTYARRKPETTLAPKATTLQNTKAAAAFVDKENASANLQTQLATTKPTKQETVVEKSREIKRARPQEKRAPLGNLLGPPPTKRSKIEAPAAKVRIHFQHFSSVFSQLINMVHGYFNIFR
jgi:hypothetical protein